MPMPVHGGGSSRMLVVAAWVGVASAATADRPRWLAAADADLTRRLCAIEASP